MLGVVVILAVLVLALTAALIITRLNNRDEQIDTARRNAAAYNETRNLIVLTLAGHIQEAADRLPALESMLSPPAGPGPVYTIFRLVVDNYKPPTIDIVQNGGED